MGGTILSRASGVMGPPWPETAGLRLVSRPTKLYMRVASAPATARFDDAVSLAKAVGFVLRRVRGSHHIFLHRDDPREILVLVPHRGGAKEYQVRQLLAAIERLGLWR